MCANRMHADQLDVDESLVRRLLAAQFSRWAHLPLTPVESPGTVNALYRLGGDMVVRIPLRPTVVGEDLEKESTWVPRLAPLLPVPVPLVLGEGAPSDDYPGRWAVARWLDGDNPEVDRLARPDALARDLAEFVAAYRSIDVAGGPPAYRGGPLASQDRQTRGAIAELAGMVDTDAATAVWDETMRTPDWQGPPVWVHADLMPGNLLVRDGRLGAVIDLGTTGVGDPACDLIVAWNLLPPGARDVFRAAVDVDEDTWARGRGRALSMALIQLPYYQVTNPAMASNARHVIGEVLADHSAR